MRTISCSAAPCSASRRDITSPCARSPRGAWPSMHCSISARYSPARLSQPARSVIGAPDPSRSNSFSLLSIRPTSFCNSDHNRRADSISAAPEPIHICAVAICEFAPSRRRFAFVNSGAALLRWPFRFDKSLTPIIPPQASLFIQSWICNAASYRSDISGLLATHGIGNDVCV